MAACPKGTSSVRTSLFHTLTHARRSLGVTIALALVAMVALSAIVGNTAPAARSTSSTVTYRIDHVADGDTVDLHNGARVRLVQIDTPEVYFGTECYGPQASAITKRLLPPGTAVRLLVEPATNRI